MRNAQVRSRKMVARQDFARATREASQKIKERTLAFAAATGIRGLHLALDSHLRESRSGRARSSCHAARTRHDRRNQGPAAGVPIVVGCEELVVAMVTLQFPLNVNPPLGSNP